MAELPRVAKHLHVPAQHGNSRILRLMGRRYTREDYLSFAERARRIIPGVELLSDFITGFPRETEEDHEDTLSLMREVRFDGAFVFMYSPRPGTGSSNLPDDVPDEVKRRRCNELLALQLEHQQQRYSTLVDNTFEILIEGPSKSNPEMLSGRSIGNLNIHIPRKNSDGSSRDELIGELVNVKINTNTNLSLFADLV